MKLFRCSLIIIFVFLLSICSVYAEGGFGGGSHGGSWGLSTGVHSGGGTSGDGDYTVISYEALSTLCVNLNEALAEGVYDNVYPFSAGAPKYCTIRRMYHATGQVITFQGDIYSSYFIIATSWGGRNYAWINPSGYEYIAVANEEDWGGFRLLFENVDAKLNSIKSALEDIEIYLYYIYSNMTGEFTSPIVSFLQDSYACGYYSLPTTGEPYPHTTISTSSADIIVALLNTFMPGHMIHSLGPSYDQWTSTQSDKLFLTAYVADGVIYVEVKLDDGRYSTLRLCNAYNHYFVVQPDPVLSYIDGIEGKLDSISSGISSILDRLDNLTSGGQTAFSPFVAASSYNPESTTRISFSVLSNICSYLNSSYVGKPILLNGIQYQFESARLMDLVTGSFVLDSLSPDSVICIRVYLYDSASGQEAFGVLCSPGNKLYTSLMSTNFDYMLYKRLDDIGSTLSLHTTATDTSLQTIIELLQDNLSTDTQAHEHIYTRHITQDATCTVPGLATYTCDECGYGYTELLPALGHDWEYAEHVNAVLDENDEVVQPAYDIYTCTRCNHSYQDHDGTGAPEDSGGQIGDLITSIFSRLGNLAGSAINGLLSAGDSFLTGLDDLATDFNDKVQQVQDFGGDYPTWLAGFYEALPADLQLALSFCLILSLIGICGKRLVFAS